jgi:hypothetical protein
MTILRGVSTKQIKINKKEEEEEAEEEGKNCVCYNL